MFIDWKLNQVNLKIIYYGPPQSGKTTNLHWIRANAELRGETAPCNSCKDQGLFFEFIQVELDPIHNLKPKLNLYTVAGEVHHKASHKLLMQGVDGVIFVADSQASRVHENVSSMHSLVKILSEMGFYPDTFPMVIQYNKRDLSPVLPLSALAGQPGHDRIPHVESIATRGTGVLETLQVTIDLVLKGIQRDTPQL